MIIKKEFDKFNPYWQKDERFNRMFLQAQENYVNDLLTYQGYVLLSKVYELLGIPLAKGEELTLGWTKNDGPIRFNPTFAGPNAEIEFDVKNIFDYFEQRNHNN